MDDFHIAGSPPSSSEIELNETVAKVAAAVVAMRNAVRRSLVKLPDRAPAIWANRADRLPGENPIAFLSRVWGRFLDAGVLYQNDLPRLGDKRLCQAIRNYCHYHGMKAAENLPPPKSVRTDDALKAVHPDSPEAHYYRLRVVRRDAHAAKQGHGVPAPRRKPR